MTDNLDHEVLIVGAGFSGIGTAIALSRAGIDDFALVDDAAGFGGTWHWNRYPGVAVDVPSFSYQFSFAQNPDWSRSYAPGAELRAYAENLAQTHDLPRRTTFGVRVGDTRFDEDSDSWVVTFEDGHSRRVRYIIDGTGVLTVPKRPAIGGLDDFAGVTIHTARWDESVDLRGKRVAIVGTGASAIQIIPTIAEYVDHLTVFQRTPIWCLPKGDVPLPGPLRTALKRVPPLRWATRATSEAFVELAFPVTAHFHKPLHIANVSEYAARAFLRSQVHDPDLRDKLTPHYPLGCKRPSFHNGYLAAYNRDNVALETTSIARVTPTGVQTSDGAIHEVDVLILATGFKVYEPGNLPKYPVMGRSGRDLDEFWEQNRYRAYHGTSVPGFPNYFFVLGPYAWNGASYFGLIEHQATHIVRCLKRAKDESATAVEVTVQAEQRFFDEMIGRRGRQVFWQAGCDTANSYYFDRHGDVPLRASLTVEDTWRSKHFPLDDYSFTTRRHAPLRSVDAARVCPED
ncbi:MAG: NAD(P)/FAD-dependent oxidoreductase [Propionibacteriales bacterium]|nr:NAD(P)/FAD-dependent oxidoreductase [Propionibacteriales bacterium]